MFLKIPQFSKENTYVGGFFNKVAGLQVPSFMKKRLQHRCFPENITKFLRTPIFKNISERLRLWVLHSWVLPIIFN